jgi:hypothetical protein
MTPDDLARLRLDTDIAIERVRPKATKRGPVNWADLHCMEAAWVVTDDEQQFAQVTIEEASPEAADFQRLVKEELEMMGWPSVVVVTEW